MNWETLLCFGDSITFGARSYLGYPEICGNILQKTLQKNWNVINHSTNGFTTIDLVRSIDGNYANMQNVFPSIISVMIGTNDIKAVTEPEEFEIAYNLLITKLKLLAVNNNILILKIPGFTNKVFYPYTYSMNTRISIFNESIKRIADRNEIKCIELIFGENDFFDGVHLNSQGCFTAAHQLALHILKDKGIESTSVVS